MRAIGTDILGEIDALAEAVWEVVGR